MVMQILTRILWTDSSSTAQVWYLSPYFSPDNFVIKVIQTLIIVCIVIADFGVCCDPDEMDEVYEHQHMTWQDLLLRKSQQRVED